jgi:hypothetical protein
VTSELEGIKALTTFIINCQSVMLNQYSNILFFFKHHFLEAKESCHGSFSLYAPLPHWCSLCFLYRITPTLWLWQALACYWLCSLCAQFAQWVSPWNFPPVHLPVFPTIWPALVSFFLLFLVFQDRITLYILGCAWTHDPSSSASQILGL